MHSVMRWMTQTGKGAGRGTVWIHIGQGEAELYSLLKSPLAKDIEKTRREVIINLRIE